MNSRKFLTIAAPALLLPSREIFLPSAKAMLRGGFSGAPWSAIDGSANAPTGTAQYPHLLDLSAGTNTNGVAFNTRPPWAVAGVDYRTGINTGVSLTPVTSSVPAGFTLDTPNKQVTCGGSIATLDGYDFTAAVNGGSDYRLNINGGSAPITILNSKFKQRALNSSGGLMINGTQGCGFLTIKYCQFDGNGAAMTLNDDLMMMLMSSSGGIAQYNWFKNGVSDGINVVGKSGNTSAVDVRFNFIESLGLGAPSSSGDPAHADFLQSYVSSGGSGTDINGLVCNFNCMYQPTAAANGAGANVPVSTDSFMLLQTGSAGAGGAGSINSPECGYNTCVGIGGTHYYFQTGSGHNTGAAWLEWISLNGTSGNPINNPYIHDNCIYADTTIAGTTGGFTNFVFYPSAGQFIVNQSYANNINLYNGSAYTTNP